MVFAEQALERLALVATGGERNLPGVRRRKLTLGQLLPDRGLRLVTRLRVGEEQYVAQLHRGIPAVLGPRRARNLAQAPSQSLLYLRGKRLASGGPVDGEELREFVG